MSLSQAELSAIIAEHRGLIRRQVARHLPADTGIGPEDLEQEVVIRLWRALASEREIDSLSSYIHRIVTSAAIDALRHASRRPRETPLDMGDADREMAVPALASPGAGPALTTERQATMERLVAVIDELPERRRLAVKLHLQGFGYAEIARLNAQTEASVRNLVSRGMRELRALLTERGIDEHELE